MWYRAAGDQEWHGGVTENISACGVAIRADESDLPSAAVTIVISLPAVAAETGACLVAQGRVMRNLTPGWNPSTMFAVRVNHYRFHRRG